MQKKPEVGLHRTETLLSLLNFFDMARGRVRLE